MALASLEGGARLIAELKNYDRKRPSGSVDVGFFEPEAASVALYAEYGTVNEPVRPFMFIAINTRGKGWADALREYLADGATVREALTQVGRDMQSDIMLTLSNPSMFKPNAKRTIKKKGFNAPLIETGAVLRPKLKFKVKLRQNGEFGSLT